MPSASASALSALGLAWPSVTLHRLFGSTHATGDAPSNFMLCSDTGTPQDWMTVGDLGGNVRLDLPTGTSFWTGDAIRGIIHVDAVERPLRRVQVKLLEQEQLAEQPTLIRAAIVWERGAPDGRDPVSLRAVPFALSLAPSTDADSICPSVPSSARADWRGAAHLLRFVIEPCAAGEPREGGPACGPAEAEEAWNTLNVTIAPREIQLERAWQYPALAWVCRRISRPLLRIPGRLWAVAGSTSS